MVETRRIEEFHYLGGVISGHRIAYHRSFKDPFNCQNSIQFAPSLCHGPVVSLMRVSRGYTWLSRRKHRVEGENGGE